MANVKVGMVNHKVDVEVNECLAGNTHMSKNSIRDYITLDRALVELKYDLSGVKVSHGLSRKDIRSIRESLNNLGRYEDENGFFLVTSDSDSSTWKRFYPNKHFAIDERRDMEEDMWIGIRPSMYDCTGQEFTTRIKFFDVPNGTWVYHFKAYDV